MHKVQSTTRNCAFPLSLSLSPHLSVSLPLPLPPLHSLWIFQSFCEEYNYQWVNAISSSKCASCFIFLFGYMWRRDKFRSKQTNGPVPFTNLISMSQLVLPYYNQTYNIKLLIHISNPEGAKTSLSVKHMHKRIF